MITPQNKNIMLAVALFGLFVPNGMFFYYLFVQFSSLQEIMNNLLALGFIIDAFMATGLLSYYFAKNPIGKYSWKTFLALSLLGGLGFSLPFFYYINVKKSA